MGCCMKQKGSLRYTVLCMIACSTGILQQLIAEAAGCTDTKKAAAFAFLGAGFLLYGLWESYLSELSSWIPLISFTCTALLPLCSFHWLILIPFALFSGMLLSFCLSRFLSAAPEKRRYLKLGAAFGLYASGQALYTVLLLLLPGISFSLQFMVLSVCPLFVFLLNYRNAAGIKQAHGSPRFLLQHTKGLCLTSFAGLVLLLVLHIFIFQALYGGTSAPSGQIVRIAGFFSFPAGLLLGLLFDRKAGWSLVCGLLLLTGVSALLPAFPFSSALPAFLYFRFAESICAVFVLFFPALLYGRRHLLYWCGFGFLIHAVLRFLRWVPPEFFRSVPFPFLCAAGFLICGMLAWALPSFLSRSRTETLLPAEKREAAADALTEFRRQYALSSAETAALAALVYGSPGTKAFSVRRLRSIYKKTKTSEPADLAKLYFEQFPQASGETTDVIQGRL